MTSSSSIPGRKIERTKQTGAYSFDYRRDEAIYLLPSMPSVIELSALGALNRGKGAYFFITEPLSAHYLDSKGKVESLPIPEEKLKKLFASQGDSSPLNHGVEFYLMREMPDNPVAFVKKHDEKEKPTSAVKQQYAYILCDDTLYFIDKKLDRYIEVKNVSGIQKLNQLMKGELKEDEFVKFIPKLSSAQLAVMPSHGRNVAKVAFHLLPAEESMDKQKLEAIYHLINACPGHTHGEYGVYRTIVTTRDYPLLEGELINGLFGEDDELSVFDTIEKNIDAQIGSLEKIEQKARKLLKEKVFNPASVVDFSTSGFISLFEKIMHVHSHSPGGGHTAQAQFAQRRASYYRTHVKPREEMEYHVTKPIPIKDLFVKDSAGSPIEGRIALGAIPTDLYAWLVSSVDPTEIEKSGFLKVDSPGDTFVCFSQDDAKNLIANIKKFHEFNLELLAFQPFKIDGHHQDKTIDYLTSMEMLLHLRIIFSNFQTVLGDYLSVNQGKPGAMIHPVLGLQLKSISTLLGLIDTTGKLNPEDPAVAANIAKMNKELAALTSGLQDFVRLHPYKSPENTFPSSLLHHLVQFGKTIEHIVAMKKEESKSPSAFLRHALFQAVSEEPAKTKAPETPVVGRSGPES